MNEEAVRELQGELCQMLVGTVDGVTGLEPSHAAPAPREDLVPELPRREPVFGEREVGG